MLIHDLHATDLPERQLAAYDRPIGIRLLHDDGDSGVEIYLVRYAAGTRTRWHRHPSAHSIVVLEGRLAVEDGEERRVIGPGSLCRWPATAPMRHAPAGREGCLFLITFEGASDFELVDGPGA